MMMTMVVAGSIDCSGTKVFEHPVRQSYWPVIRCEIVSNCSNNVKTLSSENECTHPHAKRIEYFIESKRNMNKKSICRLTKRSKWGWNGHTKTNWNVGMNLFGNSKWWRNLTIGAFELQYAVHVMSAMHDDNDYVLALKWQMNSVNSWIK